MSTPGIGVMINSLFGRGQGAEFVQKAIGKAIQSATVDDTSLRIVFADGTGIVLADDGQSCCELRYMKCDDDLSKFVGAVLKDIEIRDAPSVEDEYGEHEVQFLAVITDRGEFTIANHNEHNGYYGGFWVVASPLEAAGQPRLRAARLEK